MGEKRGREPEVARKAPGREGSRGGQAEPQSAVQF